MGRLETGDWRLETGGWRLETEGWRLEVGGWRLDMVGFRLEGAMPLSQGWADLIEATLPSMHLVMMAPFCLPKGGPYPAKK